MANIVAVISTIGKECHSACAIYQKIGKSIMSKEQMLAKVSHGGWVRAEDDARTAEWIMRQLR
jgi:molybdopterin adenylyltransferase